MASVLVVGATGTTGSEVFRALAAGGVPVRAFVRDPARARAVLGPSAEIAAGDLGDPASIDVALQGIHKVYLASADDPRQAELQGNLIQAARRARVAHVVKLSMMGASAESPVSLARHHAQTEGELRASGLAFTILQPGFFIQSLRIFGDTIRGASSIFAPAGDAKIAFVDARDIAAVAAAALTSPGHEGETYELTGPRALTFSQVAEHLSAALGKKVSFVDVPPEAARQGMLAGGLPPWLVDDLLVMFEGYKQGWRERVTETIPAVLNRPARSIEDFLQAYGHEFAS